MKMVRWQKHLMDLFTDAPTVRFGRSDLPDRFGILGPDIAVTREETGGYTSVTAYPRTPADHFRLAALLEAIGQDITEIPEDAEPLEIPVSDLATGTVTDIFRFAQEHEMSSAAVMRAVEDYIDGMAEAEHLSPAQWCKRRRQQGKTNR